MSLFAPPPVFPGRRRPLLFGHRGASRHAPENTMESFELAVCSGVDIIELDVHLTLDGEVVVIHDPSVDRTTDGHGPVAQHTYRDLCLLDAGCRFATHDGLRPFRNRGVRIPRLHDVLQALPTVGFNIEIKQRYPSMVSAVLAVLERAGRADVVLAAGDHAIMQQIEAAQPGVALGLSARQVWCVLGGVYGRGIAPGLRGRALQIPPRYRRVVPVATRRVIRRARAAGLDVHIWTIDDEAAAARWLDLGVDGVMSDDPGALASLFEQRKAC